MKSTVTQVNDVLRKAGRAERLVRGHGYYYFFGGDAPSWQSSGIYANSLAAWKPSEVLAEMNRMAGTEIVSPAAGEVHVRSYVRRRPK